MSGAEHRDGGAGCALLHGAAACDAHLPSVETQVTGRVAVGLEHGCSVPPLVIKVIAYPQLLHVRILIREVYATAAALR